MSLGNYTAKRLLITIPTLIGMSVVVFLLLKLAPGSTIDALLPPSAQSPTRVAYVEQKLGLNQPLYVQYGKWLFHALQGDLGRSYLTNQPVVSRVTTSVWATAQLGLLAYLFALFIAVPIGILSGIYKDTWIDNLGRFIAFGGVSIPNFWLAIMLILVFALFWNQMFGYSLIPPAGYVPISEGIVPYLRHAITPALTLGVALAAILARQIRSAMVEALNEDYTRTARSKGLKERTVILNHAFRNALIPVVTIMGLQIGMIFNGTVVIEAIFQWPGVGRLLYKAVQAGDMPVVQGTVLFIGTTYLFTNLIVDVLYGYIDPQISY